MGDVLTFAPRPRPPEPASAIPSDLDLRAQIEEAAQVAVDAAQRLIDILDRMDGGNASHEVQPSTIGSIT